jgi:ATP-binding cassette subfamily F protein uup
MALAGFAARRLGKTVYDVEDVDYAVQTDDGPRPLFEDLTWHVGPGDRIGIVGVNGAGKTSLLKLLVGDTTPDEGRVVVGQTVAPAYLSQHVAELPPRARVLEAVQEVARVARIGNQEISASSLAERFGFATNRQWTPVGDLSGGERRRLQLLRLLMAEPNVLLLDEPTNDLDIDTLTALEDLLDSFPGTVLVVSHDRYFVDRVCDKVVALLGDGSLAELPGGVDEYLERRAAGGAPLSTASGVGAASRPAAPAPAVSAADARAAKKEASRLERRMLKLDADEKRLHEQLAAAAADYAMAAELDAQLRAVHAEKEQVEEEWLAAAELAEG